MHLLMLLVEMYLVSFHINAKYLHLYRDDAKSVELRRAYFWLDQAIQVPALGSSSRASTANSAL